MEEWCRVLMYEYIIAFLATALFTVVYTPILLWIHVRCIYSFWNSRMSSLVSQAVLFEKQNLCGELLLKLHTANAFQEII